LLEAHKIAPRTIQLRFGSARPASLWGAILGNAAQVMAAELMQDYPARFRHRSMTRLILASLR
jgi:hypothetical protein